MTGNPVLSQNTPLFTPYPRQALIGAWVAPRELRRSYFASALYKT
jgi:hypothetical protein